MSGTGNPYRTTTKIGTFSSYTDGAIQGMAEADPASQNWLNMGALSMTAAGPIWGGIPISESIFAGNLSSNKPTIAPAPTDAGITGFAVFNQGHHGIITPGVSNVPLFFPGMDVPFYRLGSKARIPVQASSALISLIGTGIMPSNVTWNFVTGELVPTSAGPSIAISSVSVVGSANPFTATFTTATAHGFNVGDTVTTAGNTPSGYNVTAEVLSTGFSPTTFSVLLTTNPGTLTVAGTVAVSAGSSTLAATVLSIHTNSKIVFNDPATGTVFWQPGNTAIIQL